MQQILSPVLCSNIIIYIDDILIMSESFQEHLNLVHKVLSTLSKHGVKIKVDKCEMFQQEVSFLGHIINRNGIKKSPEFISKVQNIPPPQTIKQMRQFLGLINFQRKFIQNCSTLTKPLSQLTAGPKSKKIPWSDELMRTFERVKEEAAREVMLSYPDYSPSAEKMEMYVDASSTGSGACLMQRQNQEYRVIAYASMSFSDTQRGYSTTERELSAIRWAVNTFRSFVAGIPFVVVTDHKPLIYLHNMVSTNSRLVRTVEELSEYDFEIRYRPGSDNEAADFLSRLNERVETSIDPDYKLLPKELRVIEKVDGGGDSMFESLWLVLNDAEVENNFGAPLPEDHIELRKILVEEVSKNMIKYGLNNCKSTRHKLKMMRHSGQQPLPEILLAASEIFKIRIDLYHGPRSPITFVMNEKDCLRRVFLQCISMIHYNPLYERSKIINEAKQMYHVDFCSCNWECDDESDIELAIQDSTNPNLEPQCEHSMFHTTVSVSDVNLKFCCILHTGAEVSLMGWETYCLLKGERNIPLKECNNILKGIGGSKESVIGYVELQLIINGYTADKLPIAVVKNSTITYCFLLGANFLALNSIKLDFAREIMEVGREDRESFCINMGYLNDVKDVGISRMNIVGYIGSVEVGEEGVLNSLRPKYVVSDDDLLVMQKRDFALRRLKTMIEKKIEPKLWKGNMIQQFKRSAGEICCINGLLVKGNNLNSPVIVSFSFLCELIATTHVRLGHVGRMKLMDVILTYFWHPALDRVSREVCKGCQHCQLYKVHPQEEVPTRRVTSRYPFDLVSVDLLQLEKSSNGDGLSIAFLLSLVSHYLRVKSGITYNQEPRHIPLAK